MNTNTNTTEYQGWTNYATWLVNLHYGDYLFESIQGSPAEFVALSRYDRGQYIKALVESHVYDAAGVNAAGFVGDLLNGALSTTDWYDLADHLYDDLDEELADYGNDDDNDDDEV